MKLYIYCRQNNLTIAQKDLLKEKFEDVIILEKPDYEVLFSDESEKVIAIDPDIVGWEFKNEIIDKIPNLKAICLETTGYEWVDCDYFVGREEICYYSHSQNDPEYHYMDFDEILDKSEYMFITISKNSESLTLFDDLSKFNPRTKVIIVANGFEDVALRMAQMVEDGKLGGVAFESDDLNKKYKGNVFVTPHNAYYTKESLEKMFEIWVQSMLSVIDNPINKVNRSLN